MSQAEKADESSREEATADRRLGLTQKGAYEAVSEYCEVEGHQNGRSKSLLSLRDIYHHLIKRGECEKEELLDHFRPVPHNHNSDVGRYTEMNANQWWSDVGRPQLRQLPGVEVESIDKPGATERWRFTGIPPEVRDEFDPDDHLIPLTELRGLKEQAADALDDMGVSGARRELLLSLYRSLANTTGGYTSAALAGMIPEDTRGVSRIQTGTVERRQRQFFDEHLRDSLLELPGVTVETDEPPAPEEISIDTFADVLAAEEAVEQEERELWRVEKRVEVDKRVGR